MKRPEIAVAMASNELWSVLANRPPAMFSDLAIWFSGFIHDPDDLARTLDWKLEDGALESEELVALAFRRWGADCQAHILGEYVTFIADPVKRLLIGFADALGISPLYWRDNGRQVAAGNSLALLIGLDDKFEIHREYVAIHLSAAKHTPGSTPYKDISRLRPGEVWYVSSSKKTTVKKGWCLTDVAPVIGPWRTHCDDKFRDLVGRAVSSSIGNRSGVLAELSGGLDSSTIASVAWGGTRPKAMISIVYNQSKASDESRWMDEVLAPYPYRSIRIDGDAIAPFSEFPDRFVAEPGTAITFAALARTFDEIALTEKANLILSGNGGDHVLFGESQEPLFMADYLAKGELASVARVIREWLPTEDRRPAFHLLWIHALRPLWRRLRGQDVSPTGLARRSPWISPELSINDKAGVMAPGRSAPSVSKQHYVERIAAFADTAAHNFQGYVQNFDFRYPLLYRPLVEYMYSLPMEASVRPGADRVLQRRALKGVLPEAIRLRGGKRGPDAAVFKGLRNNSDWLDLIGIAPRIVTEGFVDKSSWEDAVSLARTGHMQNISLFLQAVTLEYWIRNLDRRPRDSVERMVYKL
jgi:asparagine synthase (glutamine-hydrolysing)